MTTKEINKLLQFQHGVSIEKGYNYAVFSIRTSKPDEVAALIRMNKDKVDAAIEKPLLPFLAFCKYNSGTSTVQTLTHAKCRVVSRWWYCLIELPNLYFR